MVAVCLLLARGVARGEEPDAGETTIWVPVPVTPGDGRSYTIQPAGELPTYVRPDWRTGTSGDLPLPVPVVVIQD